MFRCKNMPFTKTTIIDYLTIILKRDIYHHVIFQIHLKTVTDMVFEFYDPLIEYNSITLTNSGFPIADSDFQIPAQVSHVQDTT